MSGVVFAGVPVALGEVGLGELLALHGRVALLAPEFAALMPPDVFTERVRQRAAAFAPCAGSVLTVDAVQPLAQNLATVLGYVTR